MAWYFSHDSNFFTPPESSSYQSIQPVLNGYWLQNTDFFYNPWSFSSLEHNSSYEIVNPELEELDDLVDRLPRDPFGMNVMMSAFPGISYRNQYFEWDFSSEYDFFRSNQTHTNTEYGLFAGSDWDFHGAGYFPCVGFVANSNAGAISLPDHRGNWVLSSEEDKLQNSPTIDSDGEAMGLVLSYLDIPDLLIAEQVCKSWRNRIKSNPLLWRSIRIEFPWNTKITDTALIELTRKAQGSLQSLSLVYCIWITDSALNCVLQSNPRLNKLNVSGCFRLTVETILFNMRALKSSGNPGIKHLKLGETGFRVTKQEFEELKALLDADKYLQKRDRKPQFYSGFAVRMAFDDDSVIDLELCPRCLKPGLVFDCPAESCQQKHWASPLCRGCLFCIYRCVHCGRCVGKFHEIDKISKDRYCFNCLKQPPMSPAVTKPRARYELCYYG